MLCFLYIVHTLPLYIVVLYRYSALYVVSIGIYRNWLLQEPYLAPLVPVSRRLLVAGMSAPPICNSPGLPRISPQIRYLSALPLSSPCCRACRVLHTPSGTTSRIFSIYLYYSYTISCGSLHLFRRTPSPLPRSCGYAYILPLHLVPLYLVVCALISPYILWYKILYLIAISTTISCPTFPRRLSAHMLHKSAPLCHLPGPCVIPYNAAVTARSPLSRAIWVDYVFTLGSLDSSHLANSATSCGLVQLSSTTSCGY